MIRVLFALVVLASVATAQDVSSPPKKFRTYELLATLGSANTTTLIIPVTGSPSTLAPKCIMLFNDGTVDCIVNLEGPATTVNVTNGGSNQRLKPATTNGGISWNGTPNQLSVRGITTDTTVRAFVSY